MSNITDEKKEKIFNKFGGRCAYCGCAISLKKMTVDHIVPKSGEGDNAIANLNPSCKPCNTLKNNLSILEFKALVDDLITKGEYKYSYPSGKKKKTQFYFEYVKENKIEIKPKPQLAQKPKSQQQTTATSKPADDNVIRIPKSLHLRLTKEAVKEGVTVEQYVVYKLSV